MSASHRLAPAYRRMRASVLSGGLIRPGDTILVACSGGPDSTALLHLLLDLSRDIPFSVSAAHFNHQLRPAAAADERFVRDMALGLDLPFFVGRADVRAEARKLGLGLEEAGRRLRYAFLERAAAEAGAGKIATGHNLSDQAETVLMRILRGTGVTGLGGIPALREGRIIRPLLAVGRDEIIAYLKSRSLKWRTDESNSDEKFLRNKIRRSLLPRLEKDYAPGIVRSLARLAALSRDEDEYLEKAARTAAARLIADRGGEPSLDAAALQKLSPALSRRVVRILLGGLKGDLRDISFDDVEAVRALPDGGALPISKTLVLERRRGRIGRKPDRAPVITFSFLWDGRGDLPLPSAGRVYKGSFHGPAAVKGFLASLPKDDSVGCVLDASGLTFPLLVRGRRPGDRYRPLGAPGAKRLKEILRAKGVPEDERAVRPVFVSGGEIVWVQGLPISENNKITSKTKNILRIISVPKGTDSNKRKRS